MDDQEIYDYMLNTLDKIAEDLTAGARQLDRVKQQAEELLEDLDETTEPVRPYLISTIQQAEAAKEATIDAASHSLPGKELAEFNRVVEPLRTENEDEFTQIVNQDD